MPCTFHRAFDLIETPLEGIGSLIKMGYKNVLTSGQATRAIGAKTLIKNMVDVSEGEINILVGSGVSSKNIAELIASTGAKHFHASAKSLVGKYGEKEIIPSAWHLSSFDEIVAIKNVMKAC